MQNTTIKYEPYSKRHLLPGIMPFVVGALLYGTVLVPLAPSAWRMPLLVIFFFVAMGVTAALAVMAASFQRARIASWRLVLPQLLLVAGAFVFHLLVGSPMARFATVTVVMLLLFSLIMRLDIQRPLTDEARDTILNYGRLISLVGLFFLCVFAFGINQFVQVPTVIPALVLGGLFAVTFYEELLQTAIAPRIRVLIGATLGLVSAEAFVGLSFLPTSFTVNAAVLLMAQFACARLVSGVLGGFSGSRTARIGAVAAIALVALVFATARWN